MLLKDFHVNYTKMISSYLVKAKQEVLRHTVKDHFLGFRHGHLACIHH